MFKEYKIISCLDYDDNNLNKYKYLVEIVDDDFEETIIVSGTEPVPNALIANAIIKIYSKKQLNVAYNLTLLVINWKCKFTFWTISEIIEHIKKHNPEFTDYYNYVKQLLLFS